MGGGACVKIILNSGGISGTLNAIANVLVSPAGEILPEDLIAEGEALICEDFHRKLEAYEKKLIAASKS